MPSFHKPILYLDDDGITLATYAGSLVFRSPRIELTAVPENAHTIFLSGYGGSITLNAIDVAAANRVEIIFVRREQATALFAPVIDASRGSLALRVKQFAAALNPTKTIAIARKIVTAKVKMEKHPREIEREFLAALARARITEEVRHLEAKAAQVFWQHWTDFKMRFAGARTPAEWQSWPGRYIGRRQGKLGELEAQFTPRHAVHPLQAMLNFAGSVLAARMTRVVIAKGLDPCFGFLHDGRKPGRLSLVWDCIEPHRPDMVRAVFRFVDGRTFRKAEFFTIEKGIVRLSNPLAREVAGIAIKTAELKGLINTVDMIAKLF